MNKVSHLTASTVGFGLCLFLVLAGAVGMRWRPGDMDRILGTDEADYVRAMSTGAGPAYLGTSERSGVTFVAEVVDEYRRTGWARPFHRDWQADDAAGLRHYHPPVALYPLGVLAAMGDLREATLRLVPLITGVLGCLAAAALCWILLAGVNVPTRSALATLAGLLMAASPYHIESSLTIGPHAAFALLSTITLGALTQAARSGTSRPWFVACAAFGLTTLTLAYWVLLVPSVAVVGWRLADRAAAGQRLGKGVLVAIAAAFVAWPPVLLEAAFVKQAVMYASIVMNPLADGPPGAWMLDLARSHPMLVIVSTAGGVCAVLLPRARRWPFVPTALFLGGFVVLNLRVGHMKPLYASDAVAAIAALACALIGLWLGHLGRTGTRVASLVLLVAIVLAALEYDRGRPPADWRQVTDQLGRDLAGSRVLVTPRPAGAIVKYYLPTATIVLDSNHPDDVVALRRELDTGDIDVVMQWGPVPEPGGVAGPWVERAGAAGATAIDDTLIRWWRPN